MVASRARIRAGEAGIELIRPARYSLGRPRRMKSGQ